MKLILIAMLLAPLSLFAQDAKQREAIRQDVERHRQMAAAHEQAAKCLESGQKHDACQKQLEGACKGIGIGKYCGMRHKH